MVKFDDLSNKRFGRLLVLHKAERKSKKAVYWVCLCDCGNQIEVAGSSLRAEHGTRSCGCLRSELRKQSAKDYTGQKFGKLTILRRDFSKRKDHNPHWTCLCDCGTETVVSISNLKRGTIISCGCFHLQKNTERMKKMNTKSDGESALNSVLYNYKYNANKRDISFELTDEEFKNLIFDNCGYCGAAPSNKSKNRYGHGDVIYNGVDRLNNDLSYNIDNCITCCQNCNRAKYKMTTKDFVQWIKNIYVNYIKDK